MSSLLVGSVVEAIVISQQRCSCDWEREAPGQKIFRTESFRTVEVKGNIYDALNIFRVIFTKNLRLWPGVSEMECHRLIFETGCAGNQVNSVSQR